MYTCVQRRQHARVSVCVRKCWPSLHMKGGGVHYGGRLHAQPPPWLKRTCQTTSAVPPAFHTVPVGIFVPINISA